jgi:hypothetical protein
MQLFERDPVRTTQLTPFVAARVQEAKAVCGGEEAFKKLYLMVLTETEAKKAEKGLRPLPITLDVLDEVDDYLQSAQVVNANHQ